MNRTASYAALDGNSPLARFEFDREPAKSDEIEIDILFCGVCHSDIHQARNEWGNTVYPSVPGHEIVGRVTRIGSEVTRHAVGDLVGVGCMIDSCYQCQSCREGDQNYCTGANSFLATYNGPAKPAAAAGGKNIYGRSNTFGGYSSNIVVKEDFALKIPSGMPPEVAAPILCAGVTTFSPLRRWNVQAGDCVGIIGFGGLGDMAVKLAKAMGAHVTVFTHTPQKLEEAKRLGVDAVLDGDDAAFSKLQSQFDFMLSTIPTKHELDPFIPLLKRDATLCVVGAIEPMAGVNFAQVTGQRRNIAGSMIGNLVETQEVLDFCAEHGVGPDIQVINISQVNDAYQSVVNSESRFRFVIDMSSLEAA